MELYRCPRCGRGFTVPLDGAVCSVCRSEHAEAAAEKVAGGGGQQRAEVAPVEAPIAPDLPMNAIQRSGTPTWLRWALVLPAAIAAYLGIQVLVALGNSFTGLPDVVETFYSQFVNSVAGPVAFVLAGAYVAPKSRFGVALALTLLHAITTATVVTIALTTGRHSTPSWALVGACALGIVATIVACYLLYQTEHGHQSRTSPPSAF